MKAFWRYIVSIFDGMTVTTAYLFQKPVTVQYPKQEVKLAPNYRGRMSFVEENCTACALCVRSCPLGIITVTGLKLEGRKGKAPVRFELNEAGCMYCGLCVEACATDAIIFSNLFEGATRNVSELNRNMVGEEVSQEREAMVRSAAEAASNAKAAEPLSSLKASEPAPVAAPTQEGH